MSPIQSTSQSLTLSFPHPILVDKVHHANSHINGNCCFNLTLKKALWEPWPCEYQMDKQSKWALDRLPPWTEGNLQAHLSSQINLIDPPSELKSLKRVRQMIRCMFVDSSKANGDVFFSIQPKGSSPTESLDHWFLRIHPPILTSPFGTPVLVVSAIDNQLTEKLAVQGHHINTDDIARIFNESVDEDLTVLSGTLEELQLFRYVLRLNSTRVAPNTWQNENLPLGENSPWLATYLSPLYIDFPISQQDLDKFTTSSDKPSKIDETCCAFCKERCQNLKRCSRCRSVLYCSVECQRSHWAQHKPLCIKQ